MEQWRDIPGYEGIYEASEREERLWERFTN